MISKEELRSWLEGDTYHPLTHEDERGRQRIFCKLPKNGRFDYLFMPKFLASEITRHTQLECVGIYDREEKIIYDACGYFSAIDPEIEYPKNSNDMQDELTARVQALVEERVDNNPKTWRYRNFLSGGRINYPPLLSMRLKARQERHLLKEKHRKPSNMNAGIHATIGITTRNCCRI